MPYPHANFPQTSIMYRGHKQLLWYLVHIASVGCSSVAMTPCNSPDYLFRTSVFLFKMSSAIQLSMIPSGNSSSTFVRIDVKRKEGNTYRHHIPPLLRLLCYWPRLEDQGSDSRQSVPDAVFKAGKKVLLATAHRRRDYIQGKDGRVAKFMTRYDSPYIILKAFWLHWYISLTYRKQVDNTQFSIPPNCERIGLKYLMTNVIWPVKLYAPCIWKMYTVEAFPLCQTSWKFRLATILLRV